MHDFMKQYFDVVFDSGTLKIDDTKIDYVYGKYADANDYPPEQNYGFAFYVVFNNRPICHLNGTLMNVFVNENYDDDLKHIAKRFLEICKDNSSVQF